MADAQEPALPAAVLEFVNRRATEQFEEWKTTATDDQKAKGIERLRKYQEEPEY
jgi:hypothetical protein